MDNKKPFGKTAYQSIHDIVTKYNYPVCFNAPFGHNTINHPIVMGARVDLQVNSHYVEIKYRTHVKHKKPRY